MMNEEIELIRLGNIYGDFGTGYAGNVWSIEGLCPTLQTAQGGGRTPMIVVEADLKIIKEGGGGTSENQQ